MQDELLRYYERELTFVRRMAGEFAEKYPKVAGRLLLEQGKCEDPHVERLIEASAMLAARVHMKLDEEFPEITQAMLQVLYPHYLAPLPSMAVVQFELDPDQGKLTSGYEIERGRILHAKPSQDTVCTFRTCYPVTLWPVDVHAIRYEASGMADSVGRAAPAVVLTLRPRGGITWPELAINRLRFCLAGESQHANRLYEALFGHCNRIELRGTTRGSMRPPVVLPPSSLSEVGFGPDEGLLPYSRRSFLGYRLLQEYFQFPEKYLFVEVANLHQLRLGGFDADIELLFFFDAAARFDQKLQPEHVRLGCAPVVNLFQQVAEPIRVDHAHAEYRVIPDVRRQRSTEVYSIDTVTGVSPSKGTTIECQPFYSLRHTAESKDARVYWHATRRPSTRKDDAGTEVYLSLVNLDFRPTTPQTDVLSVQITSTNRDLPGLLPFGDVAGDFQLEGAPLIKRVVCLTKPTKTLRPPLGHGLQWRLVSHLSLNYLSAVGGGPEQGHEVLQEILKLYDFSDSASVQQQIAGLVGISSRPVMRRIRSSVGSGFARGIEATLEFDESRYVGTGMYLFSAVLEKFLGLYVAINSFSEMVSVSKQRGTVKRWPPRSGQQVLL